MRSSHARSSFRPFGVVAVVVMLVALVFAAPAADAQASSLYIAEVLYNPPGPDEGHEFVEIFNPGSTTVDLDGWALSGGVSFDFPAGTQVAGNGRLAIAASAADFEATYGFAPDGEFSGALSNGGEAIALLDGAGANIDEIAWDDVLPWPTSADGDGDSLVRIDPDVAPGDPDGWVAGTPTPGTPNLAKLGVLFSVERGWYGSSRTVVLQSTVPGATIRYNTNGSGSVSQIYSSPINVSSGQDVRVIQAAASINGQQGPLVTHTYVFGADQGIPVVAMWPNGLSVAPGEDEETRSFEFIPPPSTGLTAVGLNAGVKASAGGIDAGDSDKVFFRGAYGAGTLNADLFSDRYYGIEPEPQIDQLFLRNQHSDGTHLRQILAQDALLATGQLSPHGRFVRYWSDGQQKGIRHLAERPEGGFMEAYTDIDKSEWRAWSTHEVTPGSGQSNGLGRATMGAPYSSWSEVVNTLNIEALVDYQLVQWQAKVSDYRGVKNFRIAGPNSASNADGGSYRFHFFNWDLDLGYSNNLYGRGGSSGWGWAGYTSPDYLLHDLDDFDEFRLLASDRIACAHFDGGPLSASSFGPRITARYNEYLAAGGANQSSFVNALPNWLSNRNSWLLDEYRSAGANRAVFGSNRPDSSPWKPPSSFNGPLLGDRDPLNVSVSNGVLTISGAGGRPVWYRLDGGDPRNINGGQSAEAIAYTGPVGLAAGRYEIIARSFDSGRSDVVDRWSPACNEARSFDVPVSGNPGGSPGEGLVITELHYNPPTDPDGNIDGDLREFIELLNTTDAAINTSGFTIDGIGYTFAAGTSIGAGEYFVIAADQTQFQATHGFAPDAVYGGRLSDGGETITMTDAVGAVFDVVAYDDVAPWPPEADTDGVSLALIDPDLDNALAASWAASRDQEGTPGAPNRLGRAGDANCDDIVDLLDALVIAQFVAGDRTGSTKCPLDAPASQINSFNADVDTNNTIDPEDVRLILECESGLSNTLCE